MDDSEIYTREAYEALSARFTKRAKEQQAAQDRVAALEAAMWDLIDMLGRYPHPTEPEKLTKARKLLLLPQSDAFSEHKP